MPRLYARRGAKKRMGRVLANGAAYRGGARRPIFTCLSSLLSLCFGEAQRRIMYYLVEHLPYRT